MAEENKGNYSKYLLGIVGIVAVVGLFTLLINYNKGGIEDVSGAAVFRPAQQNQNSSAGNIFNSTFVVVY